MNVLTVDLGNSRCKLRGWQGSTRSPIAAAEFPTARGIGDAIAGWLRTVPAFDVVAIACVAGPEIEAEVERELRRVRPEARLAGAPDPRLAIECREPASVGRDRLFAARGALDLVHGDAIVVGAGTALTVDAVRADATFLGGAIAPGPALLARALADGTAHLPRIEPRAHPGALGRDTNEALQAGVGIGFRGAAKELVERVSEASGLLAATVVLTGGARSFLLDPPAFAGRRVVVEPDLVHLGLLAGLEREAVSWTSSSPS